MKRSSRVATIVIVAALAAVALIFFPPLSQPEEYHNFADQREFFGLPHFLNVASNLAFLLVGAVALIGLFRPRPNNASLFLEQREKWPWFFLFLGTVLTGLGSAWYHWEPSNSTLVWNRLPMTMVAMSLLAAVVTERIGIKTGLRWLAPLLIGGALSVLYWIWSEQKGAGDLRPYGFVQFLPLLLIPLLILLFPPRYTRTGGYFAALGWYLLAKCAEALDSTVYAVGAIVSGHTLKHLLAAVAVWSLYRMLSDRGPVPSLQPVSSTDTKDPKRRPHQKLR